MTGALLAGLVLAGCSETTAPEDDDLTAAQAEVVATYLSDVDATGGDFYGLSSDARTGDYEFSRTESCPSGGSHSVSGSGTKTLDTDTRVLSTTWNTTQSHDNCTFTRTRGDRSITVVINGSVIATGAASYQLPSEPGGKRQILSFTNSRSGVTTTTVGDRLRSCRIDVTETYDPGSNTFRITGTVCGRDVDVTRPPGDRGRG